MKMAIDTKIVRNTTFAVLSCSLMACGSGPGQMMSTARECAVLELQPTHREFNELFPASVQGRQDIEIRPQVQGFITKLCVDEGASVKKGQTLFIIDPVQYQEAVNAARAAVQVAEAQVATAELTAANRRNLQAQNIVSEYDRQTAENNLASAKAQLASAKAQLITAEKNLSFTNVVSPSDGVVGQIPFRVGALVGPSVTVPLTTVSDISKMYAYFSMTEKKLLSLLRDASSAGITAAMPEVQLQLADGTIYPEKGKVETVSGVIDPTTGTVSVRAAFNNPNKVLRSGGSAIVLFPYQLDSCLVIPQRTTYEIQDKKFVYRVTDSSTVVATEVQIFPLDNGSEYVVTGGLNSGDKIAAEGVASMKNGMQIVAKPAPAAQPQQ